METRRVTHLALALWALGFATGLVAGCANEATVKGCPVAIEPAGCAALVGADLPARCEEVLPGSAPLVIERPSESAPFSCAYPPAFALFAMRLSCGDSRVVELWCNQ